MKLLRCLSCLLAVLLFLLPCAAEESPETVRQSVVHLYAVGDEGLSRWTGSGFAVGVAGTESDVFLTNWHVVTGNGSFSPDRVRLWILKDGARFDSRNIPLPDCAVECRILALTEGVPDVAVIRSAEPIPGALALPLLSSREIPDGARVYALGFGSIRDTHNASDAAPEDVLFTRGSITDRLAMKAAGGARCLIHSAVIGHGCSGGPLVDDRGNAVGINTYGFDPEVTTELFCSLYIDYGMELLEKLDIPFTRAEGLSPVHVLMANLLRLPNLGAVPAWVLFVLLVLCGAWLARLVLAECFRLLRGRSAGSGADKSRPSLPSDDSQDHR